MLRLSLLAMVFCSLGAQAAVDVEAPLAGYAKVRVDVNYEQKDPLNKVVNFEFPAGVQNVGQSINYVLSNTGYALEDLEDVPSEVLRLFTLKIPVVSHAYHHSSVRQVLDSLVGSGYRVHIDDVRRVVSVRVAEVRHG